MSIKTRSEIYESFEVDGNLEKDPLSSTIHRERFSNEGWFIVRQQHVGRLDLVSSKRFRTPDLDWLIAQENDILDPLNDMYVGQRLRIPSLDSYYKFYNRTVRPR